MRPFSVALAAAAVLVGGSLALATYSGAFQDLWVELAARRDDNYSGTLDKTQQKELAAINKALAAVDAPSDDLGTDIKVLGKITKGLQKAFPSEFTTTLISTNFRAILIILHRAINDELQVDLDDLDARIPALSAKGAAVAQKFLDQAQAALNGADTSDFPPWVKALAKAYKAWAKAQAAADKDPGPTASASVTIDGTNLNPSNVTVLLDEVSGLLVFSASKPGTPGRTVQVTPGTVFGTGEAGVSVGTYIVAQLPPLNYLATSTTSFVVTALDTAANTISFTFDFTAPGQLGSPGSVHVVGSYSGPYTAGT